MKKKIISCIITLCLIVSCAFVLVACGNRDNGNKNNGNDNPPAEYSVGLEYELLTDASGYAVVGVGDCDDEIINIPATYKNKPVKVIDDYAFRNYTFFNEVIFSENICEIGQYAFSGCSSLTKLNISENIDKIGSYAFQDCVNIANIYWNSKTLTNTNSNQYTFKNIGANIKNGINVYIGEKTIKIPSYLFYGANISYLELNSSLETIGTYAFSMCRNLKKVNVTNANNLKVIESSAFSGCYSLIEFTIPSSITTIGNDAFWSCSKLVEITNLSSLQITMGSNDYGNIGRNVKNIRTSQNNTSILYQSGDFVIAKHDSKYYIVDYVGVESNITIPNNLYFNTESIAEYSLYMNTFAYNKNIESITTNNKLKEIDSHAFYECSNLVNVNFLSSTNLVNIEGNTFNYCTKLESVKFPSSLDYISSYLFTGCLSLNEIYFQNPENWVVLDGVNKINVNTSDSSQNATYFLSTYNDCVWYQKEYLSTLKLEPTVQEYTNFTYTYTTNGSRRDYQVSGYNGTEVDVLIPDVRPDGYSLSNIITGINANAFENSNIRSLWLHRRLNVVDVNAFANCTSLEYIVFCNISIYNSLKNLQNVKLYYSPFGMFGETCDSSTTAKNFLISNNVDEDFINNIYFYSSEKPTSEGNYWHYVGGVITEW